MSSGPFRLVLHGSRELAEIRKSMSLMGQPRPGWLAPVLPRRPHPPESRHCFDTPQALGACSSSSVTRSMTMPDNEDCFSSTPRRTPWNKGKLIGAKPPLRPKHVWSIRTRLLVEGRTRDLAMFNLAIDSKLRGCDVVALKVDDVAPNGYAIDRATVRQKKTGWPVKFELTDQTRQAVDDYLKAAQKKPGEFLFTGRRGMGQCMTTR